MAAARHAASPSRRSRTQRAARPAPRGLVLRGPISRVRWDRLGRTAMLAVFALVAYVGIQGAISYLHARGQAEQQQAIVQQLARQNRGLEAQVNSLHSPSTIVRDARALGMVRAGERAYVVTGLPNR